MKKIKVFLYFEIVETNDLMKESEKIKTPKIFIKGKILQEIDKNFSRENEQKSHLI